MAQPSIQGRFVWQELMTNDTAAAAAFYPKITGWQASPSPHDASYIIFRAGTGPVAGLMKLPADAHGTPPHWLPYVGSDNVDTTVAAAEKLGAKVLHASTEMAGVGRFAVLADPQGAAFGIYKPASAMPEKAARPSPGEFAWQELGTSNLEAAFEFYRELFGWQAISRMDMGPAGTYLVFGQNGVQRGGMHKLNPPAPSRWLPYIEVPDADAAGMAARAAGARIVNGPMDVPGGRMVQLLDSHEILVAVHSAAPPAAAKSAPKKTPAKVAAAPAQPAAKPAAASAAKSGAASSASAAKPAAKAAPAKTAPAKKAPAKKPAKKVPAKKKKSAAKKKAAAKKSVKRAKKKNVAKSAGRPTAKRSAAKKAKKKARGKSAARGRGKKKAARKK